MLKTFKNILTKQTNEFRSGSCVTSMPGCEHIRVGEMMMMMLKLTKPRAETYVINVVLSFVHKHSLRA